MSDPYATPTEVDDDTAPKRPPKKRPTAGMLGGVIFVLTGIFTILSGAILEGVGAFIVAACCASIGIDPPRRKR